MTQEEVGRKEAGSRWRPGLRLCGRPGATGKRVPVRTPRVSADGAFRLFTWLFAAGLAALFVAIVVVLWQQSQPAMRKFGFGFLTSVEWNPVLEHFGAVIAIAGTLISTTIAMLIAIPVSIGIALFLAEIAPPRLRTPVGTAIELLAAIPSIVYGMWGLFVVAPIMAESIEPWLIAHLGFLPLFSGPPLGIGLLSAGLVLALMVIPFIAAVTRDGFLVTPRTLQEAAYGRGCSRWE